ncbi:ROK family protein [Buchananella hordeovulneris]|uniref:ROK family protein n=1 Tax=Buchananella hordeovulneris TaxID=52770 RepID=UPI000F5EACFA|nr:ROK family protein [Buchananella hordeovulneris]RRD52758.1 ROK family protein [Buchananella hordeovulneris]
MSSEVALVREVLIHGPISRAALTGRLDLSPASLTRLAKPLLDVGILHELQELPSGDVGRPSRPLAINPDLGDFVGIKLTGEQLYAVRTDMHATIQARLDTALPDRRPQAVARAITAAATTLATPRTQGVGLSLGGFPTRGVVHHASFLNWREVDLARLLRPALSLPTTIENDLVALAEFHRWFGVGRSLPGFTVITLGAGVGYALAANGAVVRTPDAGVGSVGHLPLAPDGPRCAAGHPGCSQALLTSPAIAARVSAALGREVSFPEVLALAAAHQGPAWREVQAAGKALGTLIAWAANLTHQAVTVVGGEGIGLYPLVADVVAERLQALRPPAGDRIAIHLDDSNFFGWARAAAVVAIQEWVLNLPRGTAPSHPRP